jgi:hypothetical protein
MVHDSCLDSLTAGLKQTTFSCMIPHLYHNFYQGVLGWFCGFASELELAHSSAVHPANSPMAGPWTQSDTKGPEACSKNSQKARVELARLRVLKICAYTNKRSYLPQRILVRVLGVRGCGSTGAQRAPFGWCSSGLRSLSIGPGPGPSHGGIGPGASAGDRAQHLGLLAPTSYQAKRQLWGTL